MGRFPDRFLDEIRERCDLLEVVGRHTRLRKAGVNWLGLCPFHQEKTPSFTVRPDKGHYKCFGCGVGGDLIDFVMRAKNLPFEEAVTDLAREAGLPLPELVRETPEVKRQRESQAREQTEIFALLTEAERWFQQQLQTPGGLEAREYLRKRGIAPQTVERFGLGYAPPGWRHLLQHLGGGEAAGAALEKAGLAIRREASRDGGAGGGGRGDHRAAGREGGEGWYDRFRRRLIFPIHDGRGRCAGFGARALDPADQPKYLNSPETAVYRKGEILFGLHRHQEAIRKAGAVLVVEGYMDLIALDGAGVENVVATLGTALTPAHLKLLWRGAPHVVFCFDGDAAGRKAAWKALEQVMDGLEAEKRASFLFLPDGEDPDETVRREGAEGFRRRVGQAVPLTTFLLDGVSAELGRETPEARASAARRLRELLAKVGDPLLRELMADEAGRVLRLPPARLLESHERAAGRSSREWGADNRASSIDTHERIGEKKDQKKRRPFSDELNSNIAKGFDYERKLVGLLLLHPELALEKEEWLMRLKLSEPYLASLFQQLMELIPFMEADPAQWPWARFKEPDEAAYGRFLRQWEKEFNLDDPLAELEGCLGCCHRELLKQEGRRLEGEDATAWMRRMYALTREEQRSRGGIITWPKDWHRSGENDDDDGPSSGGLEH
ncbi:MAG: DNA primase [Magnetococcales bacterium]|nr:DNA primase [Magnetococcales bacterium]